MSTDLFRHILSLPLLCLGASYHGSDNTGSATAPTDVIAQGPCQRCEISYSLTLLRGSAANCFQLVETGTTLDNSNPNFLGQCPAESPPCARLTCSAITVSYDISWSASAGCAQPGAVTLITRIDGDTARVIAGAAPMPIRISTRGAHCGYDSTRTFEVGADYSKESPIFITSVLAQWELISHCAGICPN